MNSAELELVVTIVPRIALPPGTPFTSHATAVPAARQKDAVKLCVCPSATLAVCGAIELVLEQVIVTLAFPDFVASAMLVAVTVTVGGDGSAAGAVKTAVVTLFATIVPSVALPPAIPFTLHVTPFAGLPVPVTVAVNTCAPPVAMLAGLGATVTAMSSLKFTAADPLAWGSALLTAVTVTVAGDGRFAGAVYKPAAVIAPVAVFPPATLFTFHATPVFVVPVTLGWNCCVCPRNRFALVGCMVTTTGEGPVEDELVDPQPGSISALTQKSARRRNERLERSRARNIFVLLGGSGRKQSRSSNGFMCADA